MMTNPEFVLLERIVRPEYIFAVFYLKNGECGVHIWTGENENPPRYGQARKLGDALREAVHTYVDGEGAVLCKEPMEGFELVGVNPEGICLQLQEWVQDRRFFYVWREDDGRVSLQLRRKHFHQEWNVQFRSPNAFSPTEYTVPSAPGERFRYREERVTKTGLGQDFWSAAQAAFNAPECNFVGGY